MRVASEDLVPPGGLLCSCGSPDGGVLGPVHGYSPPMGYREWRARQNERVDAMVARADQRAIDAKAREGEAKVERAAASERARVDGDLAWFRSQAERLREDHDDLTARAAALGMPEAPRGRGSRAAAGVQRGLAAGMLLSPLVAGGEDGGSRVGPYEAWRDRIVVEERFEAKVARGEELGVLDRAALRIARLGSAG